MLALHRFARTLHLRGGAHLHSFYRFSSFASLMNLLASVLDVEGFLRLFCITPPSQSNRNIIVSICSIDIFLSRAFYLLIYGKVSHEREPRVSRVHSKLMPSEIHNNNNSPADNIKLKLIHYRLVLWVTQPQSSMQFQFSSSHKQQLINILIKNVLSADTCQLHLDRASDENSHKTSFSSLYSSGAIRESCCDSIKILYPENCECVVCVCLQSVKRGWSVFTQIANKSTLRRVAISFN